MPTQSVGIFFAHNSRLKQGNGVVMEITKRFVVDIVIGHFRYRSLIVGSCFATTISESINEKEVTDFQQLLCGTSRIRTGDTRIFSPMLYLLS